MGFQDAANQLAEVGDVRVHHFLPEEPIEFGVQAEGYGPALHIATTSLVLVCILRILYYILKVKHGFVKSLIGLEELLKKVTLFVRRLEEQMSKKEIASQAWGAFSKGADDLMQNKTAMDIAAKSIFMGTGGAGINTVYQASVNGDYDFVGNSMRGFFGGAALGSMVGAGSAINRGRSMANSAQRVASNKLPTPIKGPAKAGSEASSLYPTNVRVANTPSGPSTSIRRTPSASTVGVGSGFSAGAYKGGAQMQSNITASPLRRTGRGGAQLHGKNISGQILGNRAPVTPAPQTATSPVKMFSPMTMGVSSNRNPFTPAGSIGLTQGSAALPQGGSLFSNMDTLTPSVIAQPLTQKTKASKAINPSPFFQQRKPPSNQVQPKGRRKS